MIDVVLPLGVLAILLMVVAQMRRLISHAILNGTIRKALQADPVSARLLIEKLEPRVRWADGLAGWIMLVVGVGIGIVGLFGSQDEYADVLQISVVSIVTGVGILVYVWWIERATLRG